MMSECADGESLASFRVLPPIIKFEKDRRFLTELKTFIEEESSQILDPTPEQTYLVHRTAFDKIIEYVTAYKPLLTSIKREYEEVIESVKTGHKEAFYLRGKIQALASQPITIANYRRRCEDLEVKIQNLYKTNMERETNIANITTKIKEKEALAAELSSALPKNVKRDRRLLPGFSLTEMTDLTSLAKTLANLDSQIRDLKFSAKTKFVPKENQERLKKLLLEKIDRRDLNSESIKVIHTRTAMLNVAVEAARAFNKIMPFHQNIAEAVMKSLKRHVRTGQRHPAVLEEMSSRVKGRPQPVNQSITGTSIVDDEDPSREHESEIIFEYLEKFNELVEEERFEEAAHHAANSPRGILRTMDIFMRFDQLEKEMGKPGLLLYFAQALLSVVPAVSIKPTAELSFKCVECALNNERHDLVQHWIGSKRVTFSENLGDLLSSESTSCPTERLRTIMNDLCAFVFDQTGCVAKSLRCHLEARRVDTALDYAAAKSQFGSDGYLELLASFPELQLARGLVIRELVSLKDVCAVLETQEELRIMACLLNDFIENRVLSNSETTASQIVNRVKEEVEMSPETWDRMIAVCPSHLPFLFDMCAAGLVSDVLTESISLLLRNE